MWILGVAIGLALGSMTGSIAAALMLAGLGGVVMHVVTRPKEEERTQAPPRETTDRALIQELRQRVGVLERRLKELEARVETRLETPAVAPQPATPLGTSAKPDPMAQPAATPASPEEALEVIEMPIPQPAMAVNWPLADRINIAFPDTFEVDAQAITEVEKAADEAQTRNAFASSAAEPTAFASETISLEPVTAEPFVFESVVAEPLAAEPVAVAPAQVERVADVATPDLTLQTIAPVIEAAPAAALPSPDPVTVASLPRTSAESERAAGTANLTNIAEPDAPLLENPQSPSQSQVQPQTQAQPHSQPLSRAPSQANPRPRPSAPEPSIPLRDRLPEPISKLIYGGNTLVKIGILILFLGLSFLLRYTAERVTIPIELRYAGVALVGAGLLGLGWFLRRRRTEYALALQGMGVGVFYLTTLAAMKFHQLIPSDMGFGFLFAVSVLGALLAILQKAPILAIIAALEGFATPVLISTGSNQMMGLFTYLTILDVGIVLIAWFNAWRILNVIGFVGTFTLASGWANQYYTNEQYAPVQAFLILFFLLFTAVGVFFARRTLLDSRLELKSSDGLAKNASDTLIHVGRVDSALVFGTPLTAFSLQYLLTKPFEFGPAFSAMALGAFYLLLARVIFSRERRGMALLAEAYGIVGVIFGTLAIPLGLEGLWTGAAWAVEGAGMYWLGVRQNRPYARGFAYLVMLGASYQLLQTVRYDASAGGAVLHGSTIGPLLLAASTFSVWWQNHRARLNAETSWEAIPSGLVLWLGMGSLTLLIWQWLPPMWAAPAMTVLALLAYFSALRLESKAFVGIIGMLQALSLVGSCVKLGQSTHISSVAGGPLLQGSTIGAVLLAASAFVIYWQYQRSTRQSEARWEAVPGQIVLWLGMAAVAMLPWQWLAPHWAAAAMTVLALLTALVAQRLKTEAFVGIVGVLQALSLVGACVKVGQAIHLNTVAGGPLLQGSTIGAVLLAASAFVIYWQYQRAARKSEAHWEAVPGQLVLWLGMAAVAMLPWQWLAPHWAAAAMTVLALLTALVARRLKSEAFVGIVGVLQALSLVGACVKVVQATHLNAITGGPLLQGSTIGAVLLAASAFVIYWQYRRAERLSEAHLELVPCKLVLWLGMAALALLPWQWLVPHWAAAAMTALAVLTALVARRLDTDAFVSIIGTFQTLSLVSACVRLWQTTHINAALDGPLLQGTTIGPVLLAASAVVICLQYHLSRRDDRPHWEAIPGKVVLWLGVAALTLLPWQWLMPPMAAAATAAMSVIIYFIARRFDFKSLYPIVGVLQALAVVSFISTLHRSTDMHSNATLESGTQGMLAALTIAASILLTAGWSMAKARRNALDKGLPADWSASNSIAVTIGTGFLHLAMLFAISLQQAAIIWPVTASAALWVALRMSHTALACVAGGLHLVSAALFYYVGGFAEPSADAAAALPAFAHLGFWTPLVFGLTAWLCGDWIRSEASRLRASLAVNVPDSHATPGTAWFNHWCAGTGALWLPVLWGLGWWLAAWLAEAYRLLELRSIPQYLTAATVAAVVVTSFAVSTLARWRHWLQMGQVSVLTLPALALTLIVGTTIAPVSLPSDYLGAVAWPLALIWHLRVLKLQEKWVSPALCETIHILGFWFFLFLASREGQLRFANLGDAYSSWSMLGWVIVPAVTFWLLRSSLLRNRWPLADSSGFSGAYLRIACTPVAIYLLAWCLTSNVLSSGDAAPLPYLPILNPLELGQWLVLAALLLWWRALPDDASAKLSTDKVKTIAAAIGWFLLTAMVLRSCHHWAGVEWTASALFHSRLTQAALSITWAIMGVLAMLLGNRRASRGVWFVGAGLLAVVVVKLFVIELADRGGLYRIISFIGVGVLLLIVGYFAPVPVKGSTPDDEDDDSAGALVKEAA